jgi:chemotaxis family two-component system response regulator Rcp1
MNRFKFLVVEDNDLDVLKLQTTLKEMGVECSLSVVTDGEAAVDFVLKRGRYAGAPNPDLIFLDLHLPKLSGIEVLRAIPNSRALPICVVTGSGAERDALKNQFGVRRIAYLIKPVDRYGLLNCFRCYDHLRPIAEEISATVT